MSCVVHCKKDKFDIYIGRPSKWGNPFVIGKDGTRKDVIEKYRKYLWVKLENKEITVKELSELHGKVLGCFCSPEPCHGDVLLKASAWAYTIIRKRSKSSKS